MSFRRDFMPAVTSMWSSVCRWPLNLYEYAWPTGALFHRLVSTLPWVSVRQRRGELEVVEVTRHEDVLALLLQRRRCVAHVAPPRRCGTASGATATRSGCSSP